MKLLLSNILWWIGEKVWIVARKQYHWSNKIMMYSLSLRDEKAPRIIKKWERISF